MEAKNRAPLARTTAANVKDTQRDRSVDSFFERVPVHRQTTTTTPSTVTATVSPELLGNQTVLLLSKKKLSSAANLRRELDLRMKKLISVV